MHRKAHEMADVFLPVGGFFRYRRSGERHAFDGQLIHAMQHACDTGSYESWKKYSSLVSGQGPINLRDLMDFKAGREAVRLEDVESITRIRKRLVSPGISLGALSPEAHETLSIAMNGSARNPTPARAARTRRVSSFARMATIRPARSSRSPRAGSASPPNI